MPLTIARLPNGDVVVYNSQWKLVANSAMFFVAAAFFILSALGLKNQPWASRVAELSLGLLFATCVVFSVFSLLRKAPAIVLNKQGITCDGSFFTFRPIPWSEIVGARNPGRSWYLGGKLVWTANSIILDVPDPDRARRWSRWRYSRTAGGFVISVANLSIPAEDLAEAINRSEYLGRPARR